MSDRLLQGAGATFIFLALCAWPSTTAIRDARTNDHKRRLDVRARWAILFLAIGTFLFYHAQ